MNKYLLKTTQWGLGATLFLPLVIAPHLFFPFITGKNFLFRVIIEILFAGWLVLVIRDRRYLPRRSWILIFVLVLVSVLTLSTFFGKDPSRSFWSNYERMEGLVGHLHLLAYFLMLGSVYRGEKDWSRFFHTSLFASLLVGLYALMQLLGKFQIHQGGERIDATLGNATYLAVYLLFHLFFLLYFFLKTSSRSWRIFYSLVFIFETYLLFETKTRGAILGFLGGLVVFLFMLAILSREKRYRLGAVAGVAVIFLAIGGFYLIRNSNFVQKYDTLSRLAGITLLEGKTRFTIWKMALEGFKERPILGWGLENFNLVFNKYYHPALYTQEPWFDRSHNIVFDWLIAGGVLGLLAYLGIFAASFWELYKKKDEIVLSVFVGLLAGYFFQNLFVFDQMTSYLLFFGVLGYLHHLARPFPKVTPAASPFPMQNVWAATVLILFVFVFYIMNIKPYLQNQTLLEAMASANQGKLQEAYENFKRALAYNSLGNRETAEQFSYFATQVAGREDFDPLLRRSVVNAAVAGLRAQIETSPEDARYYLFLSQLLGAAGFHTEAKTNLEKALALSPKKQQIIFAVAQIYFNEKNYDKALELLERAVRLEPRFPDARHNLIVGAITAGRDDLADAEIKKLREEGFTDGEGFKRWGSAYASRKNFSKARELYEQALKYLPQDLQLRVNLAAIYSELGLRALAIKELEEAIKINPAFKQQGEFFISELRAGRKP